MKVFSLYDFGVPSIFHFPSLEIPQELCLNEGRCCNKRPPFHVRILRVFYSCYSGKEVLEKMILVLEKSMIFSQKILCEPCLDLRMTMRMRFTLSFFANIFFLKDTLESFILLFLTRLTWLFLLKEVIAFSHQNYFCSSMHTTYRNTT